MISGKTDRNRISESIFLAKGIGILLVVIGHYEVTNILREPEYWIAVRTVIYTFHMPLFMLISGFLFGFNEKPIASVNEYFNFIKKKGGRLLYPYITITTILFLSKLVAVKFFKLLHPINEDFLFYIFLNPYGGFATLLWFIYTLFVIFSIFPLIRIVLKNELLLLAVVVILSFFRWPRFFCLNYTFQYLPFFSFGYIMARHALLESANLNIGLIMSLMIFLIGLALRDSYKNSHIISILLGTAGSLAIIFLSILIVDKQVILSKIFKLLGVYSSSIYLLHTISMGPIRILLLQIMSFKAFLLIGCLVICAGLIVPLMIEKYIIKRFTVISKLVLGA